MSAFGQEEGKEIAELVSDLLEDRTARPLLSLVAEEGGRIVGHVLFTRVSLEPEDRHFSARILAPLAVEEGSQAKGIGGRLIREGLRRLADSGVDLVFVLGHPEYYPVYGFRPARALGFEAPYPILPENDAAWMVQELRSGVIGSVQGKIRCAEALDQPQHWQE